MFCESFDGEDLKTSSIMETKEDSNHVEGGSLIRRGSINPCFRCCRYGPILDPVRMSRCTDVQKIYRQTDRKTLLDSFPFFFFFPATSFPLPYTNYVPLTPARLIQPLSTYLHLLYDLNTTQRKLLPSIPCITVTDVLSLPTASASCHLLM